MKLVLDLDHTLVHSSNDPRLMLMLRYGFDHPVLDCRAGLPHPTPSSSSLERAAILLCDSVNGEYAVKIRIGTLDFLAQVAGKFELWLYTHSTTPYAHAILSILDPTHALFGTRIHTGPDRTKSLSILFGHSTSWATVVVDDNASVWTGAPPLVHIPPYCYFLGFSEFLPKPFLDLTDVSNALSKLEPYSCAIPSTPPQKSPHTSNKQRALALSPPLHSPALSVDRTETSTHHLEHILRRFYHADQRDNHQMRHLCDLLHELHAAHSSLGDPHYPPAPELRQWLASHMSGVLHGCVLVFSGVFTAGTKDPTSHALWVAATQMGAVCDTALSPSTTHLVCTRSTSKTNKAKRQRTVAIVHQTWLEHSIRAWRRMAESEYMPPFMRASSSSPVPPVAPQQSPVGVAQPTPFPPEPLSPHNHSPVVTDPLARPKYISVPSPPYSPLDSPTTSLSSAGEGGAVTLQSPYVTPQSTPQLCASDTPLNFSPPLTLELTPPAIPFPTLHSRQLSLHLKSPHSTTE